MRTVGLPATRPLATARSGLYFTLDGSTTASQVSVTSAYNQCKAPTGPTLLSGKTYYVTIDCSQHLDHPGGSRKHPSASCSSASPAPDVGPVQRLVVTGIATTRGRPRCGRRT
ncbi:hypothetical protein GCM10018952_41610 [Streptosporangium vulgare]